MKYSVVIPLYNKSEYIGRAIDSVLNQGEKEFELLIVNDGSTDTSGQVVKKYTDPRVRLIEQVNAGEAGARNTGIRQARGKYLVFLDADDAWLPRHLQVLSKLIEDYPEAGIYCTGYAFVEPNKTEYSYPSHRGKLPRGIVRDYFGTVACHDLVATASSACVPKAVLDEVGCFAIGDRLGADQDMWARICLRYPIAFDPELTAVYYRDAIGRVCVSEKHAQELPFSTRLQAALDDGLVPSELKGGVQEYIASSMLWLVGQNIRGGNYEVARKLLSDKRCKKKIFRYLCWKALVRCPPRVINHIL